MVGYGTEGRVIQVGPVVIGEEIRLCNTEEVFLPLKNGYTESSISSAGGGWVCVWDLEELAVTLWSWENLAKKADALQMNVDGNHDPHDALERLY